MSNRLQWEEDFMTMEAAFTNFPILTTKRLRLRQIRPDDAEALFTVFSDQEAMQYYGHLPHKSLDETCELIRWSRERYARRASIRWVITLLDDDRALGTCGFHNFDEGFHRAETGYELTRAFWGQGIMTEAEAAILNYGFNELQLHRIEAIIDILNEPSKGLLLKLGFTYEGNLRQRFVFDGHFEDEHYFGLLRDEWHG